MLQRGSGVSCILKRRPTEYSDCHPGSLFCSALVPPFFHLHSQRRASRAAHTARAKVRFVLLTRVRLPGSNPSRPTAPTAEKSLNNSRCVGHDRSTSLGWDSNLISARGRALSWVAVPRTRENINFGLISAARSRHKPLWDAGKLQEWVSAGMWNGACPHK